MSYTEETIGSISVQDEGNWCTGTCITVKVDSLDKATIRFGDSYTLRITEEDVDALRTVLHEASVKLMHQRCAKKAAEKREEEEVIRLVRVTLDV
jgi:hypothetical protein